MPQIKMMLAIALTAIWMIVADAGASLPLPLLADGSTVSPSTGPASSTNLVDPIVDAIFKTLGPLAILAWYLYYTSSRTLPEKDKILVAAMANFMAECAASRNHYSGIIDKLAQEAQADRDEAGKRLENMMATITQTVEHCSSRNGPTKPM